MRAYSRDIFNIAMVFCWQQRAEIQYYSYIVTKPQNDNFYALSVILGMYNVWVNNNNNIKVLWHN